MGLKRNTQMGKVRHEETASPDGRPMQSEDRPSTQPRERIEPDLIDEYIRKNGVTRVE